MCFGKVTSLLLVSLLSVLLRWRLTAEAWCTRWFCCWPQSRSLWVPVKWPLVTFQVSIPEGPAAVSRETWGGPLTVVRQEMKLSLPPSLPPPLSLLRSCVSTWTAGGWTAGWVSVYSSSTWSSSSAPLALRVFRRHFLASLPTSFSHTCRQTHLYSAAAPRRAAQGEDSSSIYLW